jgi:putative membrane protein
LLTAWNLDPSILLGLLALGGGYVYLTGPLRQRHAWSDVGPTARQRTCYVLALATLALALITPLDALGDDYLFSAHMVQHMLLTVIFPPLFLLGIPGWLLRPALRRSPVRRVARVLTLAPVAFALFNADFWLWHLPALYDATLSNEALHIFEHLTFLVTGVLNWFPIFSPAPAELPRLPRPHQILYLFLSCQPMVVLGALFTFASQPLYAPYAAAPRLFGISALTDQQLGGLIMWIPGSLVYLGVLSVVFFVWVELHSAEEARRADALLGFTDELDAPPSRAPSPPATEAAGGPSIAGEVGQ